MFSSIPFDVILWGIFGGDFHLVKSARLLRITKILRLVKMFRLLRVQRSSLFKNMEYESSLGTIVSLAKYAGGIAVLGHWLVKQKKICFFF